MLSEYLLSKNATIDAIDVSDKMIERAIADPKKKGVNFICGDYYEHEGRYDVILVFDAYPHFLNKKKFADHSFDLLNEDGELWIIFDCDSSSVNSHHSSLDNDLSSELLPASEEVARLNEKLTPICVYESKDTYRIGLKKISKV